jgi:ADP-ribosylglycohydrolase
MVTVKDRAVGCLAGLAIGDALGTTVEFSPRGSFDPITDILGGGPFKLQAGQWTEDTSMALCLADILAAAIAGAPKAAALDRPADPAWAPKIQAVARGEWRSKTRAQIRSSGYVVDTLAAALWCTDRAGDFGGAVLLAANLGEDADTVPAVTGQIAGALAGLSGIPGRWLDRLAQGV